eukprot:c21569_g1_i6 orf=525-1625(-)
MEIANALVGGSQGGSLLDMKRYIKGSDLDNGNMVDFFGIDDLLDFSNDDIGGPIGEGWHTGGCSSASLAEVVSSYSTAEGKTSQVPSILEADGPGDICVPCDDLAELEWLSNFVEESFSSADASTTVFNSINFNVGGHDLRGEKQHFQSPSPISVLESSACSVKLGNFCSEAAVPGRARSKRVRTGACFWNTRILSASDNSANILESSSNSTLTATAPLSSDLDSFHYEQCWTTSFPTKKIKNNHGKTRKGQDPGQTRRCLHCATQKTPQWRTGPMGPKTLCNACGVRYKSGRLLPEYRPAASPTFVESIHSNSHRKVLELHKQREAGDMQGLDCHEMQPEQEQGQLECMYDEGRDGCLVEERVGS